MLESLKARYPQAFRAARIARAALPPFLILGALYYFAGKVGPHYPISKWLFWRYAAYWVACSFWSLACISLGHLTIKLVRRSTLPLLEHVSVSFAVGGFEFFLLMNVVGHLQLFKPWMFFALPLSMIAVSARASYRTVKRLARNVRRVRKTAPLRTRPIWFWPALAFGLCGAALVYSLIMLPDNVQFDSRWKHLALAEEFAAYGGLRRFPEGWTVATYPHLPSYFYGWAFLLPGGARLFDKVELAAHLEFFTFLGTLVATPAIVRILVPRSRAHMSWVVRFLFPGFFLYDSSLSAGADHIGAFFVLPLFALLVRFWRTLDWRYAFLMCFPLAGAAMAKYTITTMVIPVVGAAVAIRAAWALGLKLTKRGSAELRRNWLIGPATALGALVGLTAVHWLKNWIWYGDPTYPTLYKHMKLRPWTQDSADMFVYGYQEFQFWRPKRDWEGVKQTLKALYEFSFIPNDYSRYHGKVPTFGSLMTLLLVCLPLVRRPGRILALTVMTHAAIFTWYWTHHQDRYLQAILPWMTAITAAILASLWQRADAEPLKLDIWASRATKVALGALVSFQAIWGGDVYFYPTHAMSGSVPKRLIDFIAQGSYKKDYEGRFKIYAPWTGVAKLLPKGSRAVLHDNHVHLGINTSTVNDWFGWQYGISYGRIGSPEKLWHVYKDMGVTHVVWEQYRAVGWDSIAGDLVFFEFAYRHTIDRKTSSSVLVGKMPPTPPSDEGRNDLVAFLACDRYTYKNGLYKVTDLTTPVFGPKRSKYPKPRKTNADEDALLDEAGFAVVDPSCSKQHSLKGLKDFILVAKRKRNLAPRGKRSFDLYLRREGTNPARAAEAPDSETELEPWEQDQADSPDDAAPDGEPEGEQP
ncbi:MAG: hypothetical protein U0271_21555 [Polyangiaceae bacterium]